MMLGILFVTFLCGVYGQYEVPEAEVEILHPKGFTVSIPDEEGIKLFAFHGKINEEMNGREAGTFSRDILKSKNGRWTFVDKTTRFRVGDIIYYWTYVDYFDGERKLGYPKDDQQFVVRVLPKPGNGNGNGNGNKGNNGNGNKGNNGNHGNGNNGNKNKDNNSATQRPVEPTRQPPTQSTCKNSPTLVNGGSTCSGRLIFMENFDQLDSNIWQTEYRFAGEPDFEFVTYTNDKENLYVQNGQLHIQPTLADDRYGHGFVTLPDKLDLGNKCTGKAQTLDCVQKPYAFIILPPTFSGRINTKRSFSFLYGHIEVRAKLPKGDWIYPELFLTPKNYEYGTGYDSGEIRIAFAPGNANINNNLYGGCILGQSDDARSYGLKKIEKDVNWSDDFHVFAVKWQPDGITLLVDNAVYGNIYPPAGGFANALAEDKLNAVAVNKWRQSGRLAPFDKEMVITVGVGVGGHSFPDRPDLPKPYENKEPKSQIKFYRERNTWKQTWGPDSELKVDYINVYAI